VQRNGIAAMHKSRYAFLSHHSRSVARSGSSCSPRAKSWLQLAEANTQCATQASIDLSRSAMTAWTGAVGSLAGAAAPEPAPAPAVPALPFWMSPGLGLGAASPAATAKGLAWANPFLAQQPSPWDWMAPQLQPALPFPFNVFSAMTAPPRQPDLFDAMAATYRTASGYATAAIITQQAAHPVTSPQVQPFWWLQPYGRGWMN
jgi:hypothetical protein